MSSQANLAGYRAVIEGAEAFGRAFPMMMTAAGTIPAAKVFVMGVGVAGLQAIATARRLGAVVTATDVRPATKEQVESLGAKFLAVEDEEFKNAQTAGGYAKEMSKEYQAKQAALTAEHVKKQDIVITTALIPGRPAPKLVSAEMVKSMKPGSVLVDLAVERGGNVEGAKPGEVVDADGVKIVGYTNVAGRVAASASSLYARNLFSFIETMVDKASKSLAVNWDDELVKATALTKDGAVIHPEFPAEIFLKSGLRRAAMEHVAQVVDPFVFRLSIFVLAVFVGYFVVWSVTPALHTPLMSRDQRDLLGDRGRRAARRRRREYFERQRLGARASASSRWSSPASIFSGASLSPSACWGCTRRRPSEMTMSGVHLGVTRTKGT